MTEIKTLKDLNTFVVGNVNKEDKDKTDHINKHQLRAEAIKHVKHYERYNDKIATFDEVQLITHTVNRIKHFFNISEEELK